MARQKEDWITAQEATAILSKNAGRPIPDSYIRSLVRSGHVEAKALDRRTRLYLKSDVERYVVRPRDQGKGTGKKKEQAA
jgi:hypothetical protein